MMGEHVSVRAYARHRKELGLPGGSHTAVRKAIAAGRLQQSVARDAKGHPKLDPELADQEWQDFTDPAHQRVPETTVEGTRSPGRPPGSRQLPLPGHEPPAQPADRAPVRTSEYATARAKRERYQAELRELEYRRVAGELVEALTVQEEAFRLGRVLQSRLLPIADRLGPVLAGLADPKECTRKLRAELLEALQSMPQNGDRAAGDR